ncbi:conserved hypothetical protein [Exiguobacterium sp. 8H]|uniref:hypothetical protein n=1 Tax=unclassified Exiguobacterium TaxID=2644629 RepID=UPI0012F3C24E|nr:MULTISPECIES: hypothetical protein [unclassified Exiguobacterium]VXB52929.1 conserved hypothetical protein [Exiguobacterium sp. 8A]VXB53531.1 conserved hypothetical protein [Exiguobacterium sp. 8H]
MSKYGYNPNPAEHGKHEIHTYACSHKPDEMVEIPGATSPEEALENAKFLDAFSVKPYKKEFDGCGFCCKEIHKEKNRNQ